MMSTAQPRNSFCAATKRIYESKVQQCAIEDGVRHPLDDVYVQCPPCTMSNVRCSRHDVQRATFTVQCPTYDAHRRMSTVRCPLYMSTVHVLHMMFNIRCPQYDVQHTMSKCETMPNAANVRRCQTRPSRDDLMK